MDNFILYTITICQAVFLGWLFIVIWRKLLPIDFANRYWALVSSTTKTLLFHDDPSEFLTLYKKFLTNLGVYLIRNLAGLVIGILPLVLTLTYIHPILVDQWSQEPSRIEVFPTATAKFVIKSPSDSDDSSAGFLTLNDKTVAIDDWTVKNGICQSTLDCLLLDLLGFKITVLENETDDMQYFAILRHSFEDDNPLWPYLSDLEFYFLIAFSFASTFTYFTRSKAKEN